MEGIMIAILWAVCSLLVMVQYAPFCVGMPRTDLLIVGTIFIIGGPFFVIGNILTAILDLMMPEGWDDDRDFRL